MRPAISLSVVPSSLVGAMYHSREAPEAASRSCFSLPPCAKVPQLHHVSYITEYLGSSTHPMMLTTPLA
jgi:hypothetical protein